jgi:hypothetical protein
VAPGQIFSEYFGFPCQSSSHRLFIIIIDHPAGTIGQQWPTYQVDPVSPHPEKLTKRDFCRLISDLNFVSSISTFDPSMQVRHVETFPCVSRNLPTIYPVLFELGAPVSLSWTRCDIICQTCYLCQWIAVLGVNRVSCLKHFVVIIIYTTAL